MQGRFLTRTEQVLLLVVAVSAAIGGVSLYHYNRAVKTEAPTVEALPRPEPATQETDSAAIAVPPSGNASEPGPSTAEPPAASVVEIAVSVTGAVNTPGVYRFRRDARVQDAIAAAGGATEDADAGDLNLAASLIDGSTLIVPARASSQLEGGRLIARGGATAAELNPPQYTVSGWASAPSVTASSSAEQEPRPKGKREPVSTPRETAKGGPIDLNTAGADELDSLPGIGPKLAAEIIAYRTRTPFASVEDLTNVPGIGDGKLEALRGLVTVRGTGAAPVFPPAGETAKPKARTPAKTAP